MSESFLAVRKRTTMYVGKEIDESGYMRNLLCCSISFPMRDFASGYCREIYLTLTPDNFISIENDGLCIPNTIYSECDDRFIRSEHITSSDGPTFLELYMYTFHFTPRIDFDKYLQGRPQREALFILNALSEKCIVKLWIDGVEWQQEFSDGFPISEIERLGSTHKSGMSFSFKPYTSLFPATSDFSGLKFDDVCDWLSTSTIPIDESYAVAIEVPIVVMDKKTNQMQTVKTPWYKNTNGSYY